MIAITGLNMVLASGSPRRREILSNLGYEFNVVVPDLDEAALNGESSSEHVLRLSNAKAELVAERFPHDLVIGADTIVVLDDKILGKPFSPQAAVSMLKVLSGKVHTVYTGLSLMIRSEGIKRGGYDSTRVAFNLLKDYDIERYVESGEPLDKAGSYGIQGMGSFLVSSYDGEFDTVIGFPTKLFRRLYEEVESCRNR